MYVPVHSLAPLLLTEQGIIRFMNTDNSYEGIAEADPKE